jgi:hypothetical protein
MSLDTAEIDQIISDAVVARSAEVERKLRADWKGRERNPAQRRFLQRLIARIARSFTGFISG